MTECAAGVATRELTLKFRRASANSEGATLPNSPGALSCLTVDVAEHDDLRRRRGDICPDWCWCEIISDMRHMHQEVTLDAVNEVIAYLKRIMTEQALRAGRCPEWCACHARYSESQVLDPPTLLVALPPTVAGATTK